MSDEAVALAMRTFMLLPDEGQQQLLLALPFLYVMLADGEATFKESFAAGIAMSELGIDSSDPDNVLSIGIMSSLIIRISEPDEELSFSGFDVGMAGVAALLQDAGAFQRSQWKPVIRDGCMRVAKASGKLFRKVSEDEQKMMEMIFDRLSIKA